MNISPRIFLHIEELTGSFVKTCFRMSSSLPATYSAPHATDRHKGFGPLPPLLKRGAYELDPEAPHPRDASVYDCADTGGKSATVLRARRVGVPVQRPAEPCPIWLWLSDCRHVVPARAEEMHSLCKVQGS